MPYPGLTSAESAAVRSTLPAPRCGQCPNCQHVAATRQLVLAAANPPFSHATTADVEMWNRVLTRNPCTGGDVAPT